MLSNLNKFVEYFYKFEMNFFSISLIFFFQLYLFTFIINKILKYILEYITGIISIKILFI